MKQQILAFSFYQSSISALLSHFLASKGEKHPVRQVPSPDLSCFLNSAKQVHDQEGTNE